MSIKEDNQGLSARKNFDSENLKEKVNQEYPQLNDQQKEVHDVFFESVIQKHGQICPLDASGGAGKIHTINLIFSSCRIL